MIFGNTSYESMQKMQNSILLHEWESAGYLEPLKRYPYPDEMITSHELQALVPLVNSLSPDRLEYALLIDEHFYEMWAAYIDSYGISIDAAQLHQWVLPYEPIIDYLKVFYNRPRPFQVAGVMGIPLYPRVKMGSTEAAYPSGHTVLSCWLAHGLTARYPQYKSEWWWMVMDIKRSREELGVHYPSDGLFALRVYKELKGLWKI